MTPKRPKQRHEPRPIATAGAPILSIGAALAAARAKYPTPSGRKEKKNFAELFSRHLATVFANQLRARFPGILPGPDGRRQESRARSSHGYKKLDVNFSTAELGLGLGISIKTINARDPKTNRYTKNYSRVDNELRAEAMDYHVRQPYAVLIGVLLLPSDACNDASSGTGEEAASSFGAAAKYFRRRAPRVRPTDPPDRFERFFVGLYEPGGDEAVFHDVTIAPPRSGRPRPDRVFDLSGLLTEIHQTFDERNDPPFEWAPTE